MRKLEIIKCPRCKTCMDLSFPPSFFFNVAQVDCKKCGYRDREADYSNLEALMSLKERLTALQSENNK